MYNPLRIDPSEIKLTDAAAIRFRLRHGAAEVAAQARARALAERLAKARLPAEVLRPAPLVLRRRFSTEEVLSRYRVITVRAPGYRFSEIMDSVCQTWGVTPGDIVSKSRTIRLTVPRRAVMVLARQLTPLSLPQIGQRLGDLDHTSVHYGVTKWQGHVAALAEKLGKTASLRQWAEGLYAAVTDGLEQDEAA
jgi:hypothetical protein